MPIEQTRLTKPGNTADRLSLSSGNSAVDSIQKKLHHGTYKTRRHGVLKKLFVAVVVE